MTGRLGIDIGSLTVKVVVLSGTDQVEWQFYEPSSGDPMGTVVRALDELFEEHPTFEARAIAVTGSGGRLMSRVLGIPYVNELVAQTEAVRWLHPEARTVIEIGGQDSKLLILEEEDGNLILSDFSLNTQCAAGTGSFLEQQASRLGVSIEEFATLSAEAKDPPHIAGRCAVFAKSDIVHLQQVGTPLREILGGLCMALARNFRSDVGRGREFRTPILFQGGVSRNKGMIRAFEEVLGLKPGEIVVPKYQVLMAALGAVRSVGHGRLDWQDARARLLEAAESQRQEAGHGHARLTRVLASPNGVAGTFPAMSGYLGIDVGSVGTKAVATTEEGKLVAKVYLPTRADPIRATQECLARLKEELGLEFTVLGVGVTGSGRELVGKFVGADVVKNEITAQARAAKEVDMEADTIFEIGGQDSKFVRLEGGVVVDFTLNKSCAAGTGSFLDEQATRLGLSVEDLIEMALSAPQPTPLGERCTVFMESDLIHHQQRGATKLDIAAGLAYAVAINYLNRVVADKPIGERILFQGGVAGNAAVVAAFQNLLGRPVIVPPHFEATGAIGAALLAREGKP